jgi:hypothetical protein
MLFILLCPLVYPDGPPPPVSYYEDLTHDFSLRIEFKTVFPIRLFGFDKPDLRAAIHALLQNYVLRVDITNPGVASHSFSATAEFRSLPPNSSEIGPAIRDDFSRNSTQFGVYVIQCHDSPKKLNSFFARGSHWIALNFYDLEHGATDQITSFRIISRVFDAIKDVVVRPLPFRPRISILNRTDSIVVFQPAPLIAFNSAKILRQAAGSLADLTVKTVEFGTDALGTMCSFCTDSSCAAKWLRRLPEYANTRAENSLPIFLLPQSCPHQYASNDIAFAPTTIQTALEAVSRKALFGWESGGVAEPLFEIVALRNLAVFPLANLAGSFSPSDLRDVFEFFAPDMWNTWMNIIQNFTSAQARFSATLMSAGIDEAMANWRELQDLAAQATEFWATTTETMQRRRVCVGNLRDLTSHPIVIFRPSFYCSVSLILSGLMWYNILKLLKPRQVLDFLEHPQPLL